MSIPYQPTFLPLAKREDHAPAPSGETILTAPACTNCRLQERPTRCSARQPRDETESD